MYRRGPPEDPQIPANVAAGSDIRLGSREAAGITPELNDAEALTLAVLQALRRACQHRDRRAASATA